MSSVLRAKRGNKTFWSRLTRWVDRLLPSDFEITKAPGRVLGFADYLSKHPNEMKETTTYAAKLWNEWFRVIISSNFDALSMDEATPMVAQKGKVLTRTRESVLKVENKNEKERQSSEEKTKQRQPIKLKHGQNRNETIKRSGANLLNEQIDSVNTSTIIGKINESFLPAN